MSHPEGIPGRFDVGEGLYRLLVEGVSDIAIFLIDLAGQVLSWNPGAERLTSYAAAEMIGRPLGCLAPADAAGGPGRVLAGPPAGGRCEEEGWLVRKDGSRCWVHLVTAPLFDDGGGPLGFAVVVSDLSRRKKADEILRSILDHVIDGIITIDEQGLIEAFNPAAEAIFGYRAEEVRGRNVKLLMPEPYRGEHDGYLANYHRTGQPKIIGIGREVVGRRRDGSTFPMDLAVSDFRINDRRYYTGIVRDITDRKRLEADLRRRVEELAEADRRKDEFLAMLAHELRNPLAAISCAVQLTSGFEGREESEWSMEVVNRQIKHLARLIDDLLDVSRITRGKIELRKETVDLAAVVEGVVAAVRPLLDLRRHELAVAVAPGELWLEADPTRLEQILSNLLSNAAKYTDNGGRIGLSAEREGPEVVIRVRDTGIGIPPERVSQVFDLFAQGDRSLARSEGGLGIGLTLVRSLAELHGGSATAASEGPGRGSEFTVRLPAAEPPRATPGPPGPAAAGRTRTRVLVVDDNVDLARGLVRLLKLIGHEVFVAHDGPTALEAARTWRPEVVLLDIGLPGMDGYQVARLLRAEECGRHARIVAVTGYGHEEDRRRSREAGCDHHLVKPIEYQSLVPLLVEPVGSG